MDNIEKFFRRHQEEFDVLQPDAGNWEAIVRRQNALPKNVPFHRKRNFWLILAFFASLFVAGLYFQTQKQAAIPFADECQLEKGMVFPDIKLRSPDGELVALSSLQGKVVLVEFWASYSMVCTEENCYYFKPIYEEFKDRGFEIYAVSVDSSANSWINAIERDQLPWVQVADLAGTQSELVKKFKINKLPAVFLLNENGEILEVEVDTKTLREKLNKLLAYNKE
ncbi:MAG: peroxiredoxin family protein [Saprospiraceae bacterium]